MRFHVWQCLPLALAAVLAADAGAANAPRAVVVSIPPLKYFAERIGGNRISVMVMVPAGRRPETYEPTPRQMTALADAALYFSVAMPFERVWLDRIAAHHPGLRVVDCARLEDRAAAAAAGVDPHVWTSPREARLLAACMKRALQALDPNGTEAMESNFAALCRDLDALDAELRETLAAVAGRSFLILHPALGYFARDYRLRQVAVEREGKEPTARQLADLIDWARRAGVRTLFVQPQFARGTAEALAAEIDARIVEIDPLAEDYFASMRSTAAAIAAQERRP